MANFIKHNVKKSLLKWAAVKKQTMKKLHDINFWKRLQMFVSNVEVNDAMSMEEKEMIMRIAKEYESTSKLVANDSMPTNEDIATWANSLEEKSDLTAKGTRIKISGRCEGAKWMRDLKIGQDGYDVIGNHYSSSMPNRKDTHFAWFKEYLKRHYNPPTKKIV